MSTSESHSQVSASQQSKSKTQTSENMAPDLPDVPGGDLSWKDGQILQLQRIIGNQAVQRLLNERAVQREAHGKGCKCAICSGGLVQREAVLQRADEHEEDIQAKRIQRADEHEEDIQAKRIQRDPETESGGGSTDTSSGPEFGPLTLLDSVKSIINAVSDIVQQIKDFLKNSWDQTVSNDEAMKEIAGKIAVKDFLSAGILVSATLKQQLQLATKYWPTVSLADITPSIEAAPQDQRDVVWKDGTLMGELKTKLGEDDYLNMQPVLRVFKPGVTAEDNKSHTRADKADEYIRKYLGTKVGEAVKAGKQVEGQVSVVDGAEWADAYKREFGDDGEEDSTNAFVDKYNLIWVHKTRGNAGTIIHEGVHKYAKDDFLTEVGFDFNEGMTEFYTRKITSALGYDRGNYEENFLFATKFVNLMGEDKCAKAYFDGAVDDLKTAYEAKSKTWATLKSLTASEDWSGAMDELD